MILRLKVDDFPADRMSHTAPLPPGGSLGLVQPYPAAPSLLADYPVIPIIPSAAPVDLFYDVSWEEALSG